MSPPETFERRFKCFWWAHKFCLFLQEWRFSRSRSSQVIIIIIIIKWTFM